jgi:NAD(P)-dependent dehydrogenase (short-subunit alcohol dehydrogenase family)
VTKAATVALGKCLARDHARDKIRVNTLCPGYVDTSFNGPIWSRVGGREAFLTQIGATIPLGRMATAEEIGAMAVWLLSPEASYITGQAVVADGGELVS